MKLLMLGKGEGTWRWEEGVPACRRGRGHLGMGRRVVLVVLGRRRGRRVMLVVVLLLRVGGHVGGDRLSDGDGLLIGVHLDVVFFFQVLIVGFLHSIVQKMIIKFRWMAST